VLSFWRRDRPLVLSWKPKWPVAIEVFGVCEEFNDAAPPAECIGNS
jgi:hypothetical protein